MWQEISNIRYFDSDKIAFDFRGETVKIRDPQDVLLVGYGEAAQKWIAKHYSFCLQYIIHKQTVNSEG